MELWTEKYRPKRLSEVSGQESVVKRLQSFVKRNNTPHLLFAGSAGVGKTTAALCLARELFGVFWRENTLDLNASDERGIDTIRVKVKDFARTKSLAGLPFKIILLDEADALTKDAQHALRRIMENYTNTCRFILCCNYKSKIIDPIQSRCAVFVFRNLKKEEVVNYLSNIVREEGLSVKPGVLELIHDLSEGDLRKAINILQSAASISKEINEDVILSVSSAAPVEEVKKVLLLALNGDFLGARAGLHELLLVHGLSAVDFLKQASKVLIELDLPVLTRADLLAKLADYEFRIVEGSDPFLQLEALLAQFLKKK